MEDVATTIKAYVLVIYPTIQTDLGLTNGQLDFVVADVIDSAIVYMNRDQLVERYEQDLIDYPTDEEVNDDFWKCYYAYPIPPRLERTLAKVVTGTARDMLNKQTAVKGAVTSIQDQGQRISYAEQLANYIGSAKDSELFAGYTSKLDKYVIADVVEY